MNKTKEMKSVRQNVRVRTGCKAVLFCFNAMKMGCLLTLWSDLLVWFPWLSFFFVMSCVKRNSIKASHWENGQHSNSLGKAEGKVCIIYETFKYLERRLNMLLSVKWTQCHEEAHALWISPSLWNFSPYGEDHRALNWLEVGEDSYSWFEQEEFMVVVLVLRVITRDLFPTDYLHQGLWAALELQLIGTIEDKKKKTET